MLHVDIVVQGCRKCFPFPTVSLERCGKVIVVRGNRKYGENMDEFEIPLFERMEYHTSFHCIYPLTAIVIIIIYLCSTINCVST